MAINKFTRFLISKFHPSRATRRYYRFYHDDQPYRQKMVSEYANYVKDSLSLEQTLDLIIDKKLSVTRFGDGEFACICTRKGIRYQRSMPQLKIRLLEVANSRRDDLLVCIIPAPEPPPRLAYMDIWEDLVVQFWPKLKKYLKHDDDCLIGNSYISRSPTFELGLKDKWLTLFNNRKIVFVTGKYSRFDADHELFKQAQIYGMVDAPTTHAFTAYDDILQQCLAYEDRDILFLIALGPTATVLAYDLCLNGYQAMDIGHITNCYDVVYHGKEEPESSAVIRTVEIKTDEIKQ